jgi:hypothetical protein
MRYRRDVPRRTDITEVVRHVKAYLAGAVDPQDDPSSRLADVTVEVVDHLDGDESQLSVIGEIDGEPTAPYFCDDYDPSTDHPEIVFEPFEQPELGRVVDRESLAQFREATS